MTDTNDPAAQAAAEAHAAAEKRAADAAAGTAPEPAPGKGGNRRKRLLRGLTARRMGGRLIRPTDELDEDDDVVKASPTMFRDVSDRVVGKKETAMREAARTARLGSGGSANMGKPDGTDNAVRGK